MTQDFSLAEAVRQALEARLLELHVSTPAVVTAYDAATQKISAQPLIKRAYLDEAGNRQTENAPVITDIPVMFPGSGLLNGMTFPIAIGDTVMLEFSEQSLARLLVGGGDGPSGRTPIDPGDDRKHALSDAVAHPGFNTFKRPIANVSTTDVVIRSAGSLLLGGPTATDRVALKSDVDALAAYVAKQFSATGTGHTHTLASGGTTTLTTIPTGSAGSGSNTPAAVGASKVKVL